MYVYNIPACYVRRSGAGGGVGWWTRADGWDHGGGVAMIMGCFAAAGEEVVGEGVLKAVSRKSRFPGSSLGFSLQNNRANGKRFVVNTNELGRIL